MPFEIINNNRVYFTPEEYKEQGGIWNEEFKEVIISNNTLRYAKIDRVNYVIAGDLYNILGYKKGGLIARKKLNQNGIVKINLNPKGYGEVFVNCISEDNCVYLIYCRTKLTNEEKECVLDMLVKNKIISKSYVNKYNILSKDRTEITFMRKLSLILKEIGLDIIPQYKCDSYKIDGYIDNLNVAIEYDENNHQSYTYEQHIGRQKYIEEKLGCKFIRISDKNSDEVNIGICLKELIPKIAFI